MSLLLFLIHLLGPVKGHMLFLIIMHYLHFRH